MCAAQTRADIFDVKKVRQLIELMKEHDLSELDLRQADHRVKIRRGGEVVAYTGPVQAAPAPLAAAPAAAVPAAASAADSRMLVIKSPMVGTFYKASGPDSPAFVKVGTGSAPRRPSASSRR
ncbi:MAG: acetyl-CoA carboxylase biotin carboxyl carrier protein [Planctomycetota bacterium]